MAQPKDSLGDRMKDQYESRSRTLLPRRTHTIVRLDGKAFHSYTRGLSRPYDVDFMADMDRAAIALCAEVQGCRMAYVQSDEISLVLTDFDQVMTQAWFDGNAQKIASISASIVTAYFNRFRDDREMLNHAAATPWEPDRIAHFDSRAFTIADPVEVENYFVWRQQDATRNSIQMAAQSMFSHKEIQNVDCDSLQEMMFSKKGVNWNDYPEGFKRGRAIVRRNLWKRMNQSKNPHAPRMSGVKMREMPETVEEIGIGTPIEVDGQVYLGRPTWVSEAPPIFTKDREYIRTRLHTVE